MMIFNKEKNQKESLEKDIASLEIAIKRLEPNEDDPMIKRTIDSLSKKRLRII